jgi:hypothetical protein
MSAPPRPAIRLVGGIKIDTCACGASKGVGTRECKTCAARRRSPLGVAARYAQGGRRRTQRPGQGET